MTFNGPSTGFGLLSSQNLVACVPPFLTPVLRRRPLTYPPLPCDQRTQRTQPQDQQLIRDLQYQVNVYKSRLASVVTRGAFSAADVHCMSKIDHERNVLRDVSEDHCGSTRNNVARQLARDYAKLVVRLDELDGLTSLKDEITEKLMESKEHIGVLNRARWKTAVSYVRHVICAVEVVVSAFVTPCLRHCSCHRRSKPWSRSG